MKKILLTILLNLLTFSCIAQQNNFHFEGKKVVILGDSITHNGHYVTCLEYLLQKNLPGEKFDIISIGLSSETVSGLSEANHPFPRPCVLTRLESVLKLTKPDLLVSCYGMNDGIYHPQSEERMTAYKEGYKKFLTMGQQYGVKQFILLSPGLFEADAIKAKTITEGDFSYMKPYALYNNVLQDYGTYLKTLQNEQILNVDLNEPMLTFLQNKQKADASYKLNGDGIHPGDIGHWIMAIAVLEKIGYKFPLPSPEELLKIQNEDLFKLIRKRRELRSNAWLNYTCYSRGKKSVKSESAEAAETEAAKLQTEIDKLKMK